VESPPKFEFETHNAKTALQQTSAFMSVYGIYILTYIYIYIPLCPPHPIVFSLSTYFNTQHTPPLGVC